MGFGLKIRALLLILWCLGVSGMMAQARGATGNEPFREEQWERVRKGVDYTDAPQTVHKVKNPAIKEASREMQIVLISIVVLLLAAGILWLVIRNSAVRRVRSGERISIHDSDQEERAGESLETMYLQALENRDFRLALRFYHLLLLRSLASQGLIILRKDKTNQAYAGELGSNTLAGPFSRITSGLESAWFGHRQVSGEQFALLTQPFGTVVPSVNPMKLPQ